MSQISIVTRHHIVTTSTNRIGWEFDFGFMPYGPNWRRHRRLFWQYFHPGVIPQYHEIQRDTSRRFIGGLLSAPERLEEHIRL